MAIKLQSSRGKKADKKFNFDVNFFFFSLKKNVAMKLLRSEKIGTNDISVNTLENYVRLHIILQISQTK